MTSARAGIAALAMVVATSTLAQARPLSCRGAFARSCVRKLYACFRTGGACTRDFGRFATEGVVTDCWENGARATLDGFTSGAGTSTLTTARGRTCRAGTTVVGADFSVRIAYEVGRRRWEILRSAAGDFAVTCPDGRAEVYTAAEVVAATLRNGAAGCGPIAACAAGGCLTAGSSPD